MHLFQVVRLLLLFSGLFGSQACASDVVRTQNGNVRGVTSGQVQSFKAIPFAAQPVGKLRWMPPLEPADWTGIRDASNFSPECPQKPPPKFAFIGNEDCLYLNVFKPSDAKALPVIVFVHGGANVRDSASLTTANGVAVYDGSSLAQNGNVVVVTVNYRLGALGFIGHKTLSATSGYGGSGNYAYMDQIQALRWVQRNIAAFGGDPGNVTLFGHSAGAKSVWVHMTSPLSRGLFHRAIVHSGVREGARELKHAEQVGAELSQLLDCSNATDELACMRDKPANVVLDVMPSEGGLGKYAAVVDQKVLTDSPINIMRLGNHHQVPVLLGNVADEMSLLGQEACRRPVDGLTCPNNIKTTDDYERAVERYAASIEGALASELLRLYPSNDPSRVKAFNAIRADREYICPARRVLEALGARQREFVGRFLYTHVYTDGPLRQSGASHGFELLFIFDSLKAAAFSPTAEELALVKMFQDTWSSFARTGTPPAFWKRYDVQKDNYVIFDGTMSEGENLHAQNCKFWDALPPP